LPPYRSDEPARRGGLKNMFDFKKCQYSTRNKE
jgi:hypothetical protein